MTEAILLGAGFFAWVKKDKDQSPSLNELKKIAEVFGKELPAKRKDQSASQYKDDCEYVCFYMVLHACLKNQWENIDKLDDPQLLSRLSNPSGQSLLHALALQADLDLIEKMVGREIAVKRTDPEGNTPLHLVAEMGRLEPLKYLCFLYAKRVNKRGETALHTSISAKNAHVITHLMQYGLNVHDTCERKIESLDGKMKTIRLDALSLSVFEGSRSCYDTILGTMKYPEEVYDKSFKIGNFLHMCAIKGNMRMLDHLLKPGEYSFQKDINKGNTAGCTPLMIACIQGNKEMVKFLVGYKAAYDDIRDKKGRTPAHLAAMNNHIHILDLLARLNADLQRHDTDQKLPSHYITDPLVRGRLTTIIEIQKDPRKSLPNFKEQPPLNLVLKGGGAKGGAYFGFYQGLEDDHLVHSLERIGGASVGAIFATLIAVGYSAKDLKENLYDMNFKDLMDPIKGREKMLKAALDNSLFSAATALAEYSVKQAGDLAIQRKLTLKNFLNRLNNVEGLCEGKIFYDKINRLIAEKIAEKLKGNSEDYKNLTFGEYKKLVKPGGCFKHLHIVATKIRKGSASESVVFNSEDETYDDVVIASAVRASMSFPGIFVPHRILYRDKQHSVPYTRNNDKYVDGGVTKNFPLDIFDKKKFQQVRVAQGEWLSRPANKRTLGVSLDVESFEKSDEKLQVKGAKDLGAALASVYLNSQDILAKELEDRDKHRVVSIPIRGVSATDPEVKPEKKKEMYDSGLEAEKTSELLPHIKDEDFEFPVNAKKKQTSE